MLTSHRARWTLVTSCFSQEGTGHLVMNMLSLVFRAGPVMAVLGNSGFLALYLFAVRPVQPQFSCLKLMINPLV